MKYCICKLFKRKDSYIWCPFHRIYFLYRRSLKIKKFGIKYFFDEEYRLKCKRRQKVAKRKKIVGNYYNNKKEIKRRLFKRNPICFFCTQRLQFENATIDHIVPISKGGSSMMINLRLIHENCRIKRDQVLSKMGLL